MNHHNITRERQGVFVTWNDNGVTVICQRHDCMIYTTDNHCWWWYQQLPDAFVSIETLVAAVDAHAATHHGEPWTT